MEILRESIQAFLKLDDCYCNGNGYGDGNGDGNGNGYGRGDGYGDGDGDGRGYGDGNGYGNGYGRGDGNGNGYGNGYGYGISKINGYDVYKIDGQQTIITAVMGNVAKGCLLHHNLYMKPCYIVKGNGCFAHGETIREAREALRDKLYANLDTEQVIAEFKEKFELDKKYPAMDFYNWHHYLTGSCAAGRRNFAENHDIDLNNDTFTVEEFIALTENDYGGEIIRELKKRYGL